MLITVRGLLLLLFAAPFILAAAWFPTLWLAVLAAALAALLIVADWILAGSVDSFVVQRSQSNRLSLGVQNKIELSVRHRQAREVSFMLRDEAPWIFELDQQLLHGSAPPAVVWRDHYTVCPPRRGDYRFGDINLRWDGPLGLARRQGRIHAGADVKVYPNMIGVSRYDLLLRRNRLQEIGLRNARLTGQGTEFERLREYRPDDEYRRINWKATARRWRPITVAYQTERSQNIMAALDTGRMMQSPVGRMSKLDYAINATLLLAYVAAGVGDKVGMMSFADEVQHFIAPRQGRAQFYRILDSLYAVEARPVEPDYGKGLTYLAHKQRRRALVIIFTDITGGASIENLIQHVRQLARHSLPLVVTISDPEINDMARRHPDDARALHERLAASHALHERRVALERMRRDGVETLDTPANQLSPDVVSRYLELKRRGRI